MEPKFKTKDTELRSFDFELYHLPFSEGCTTEIIPLFRAGANTNPEGIHYGILTLPLLV